MSKKPSYTPGPWLHETGPDAPIGSVVTANDAHPIAQAQSNSTVRGSDYAGQNAMREANAQLIAAAPELLEALQSFVKVHEFQGHADRPWYQDAKKAIAKATGEPS